MSSVLYKPLEVIIFKEHNTRYTSEAWNPMNNKQVAQVFLDIADLLELKKENWFKIRAYRKAAASIEGLTVDVAQLVAEGRLREVPGVGEAINKKITELVTTGRLQYLERLKAEVLEETK
jgi:DNA polymerase (family 10)